jgi:RNA polymerase sigma-70 factor (ECF subfamily)
MSETLLSALRRLLIDDYHGLKERLGRRFGSFDFASEVLHEAWLRLQRGDAGASAAVVHNPRAYLYRVVLNVATDRQRAERSRLAAADVEAIRLGTQDDFDPARTHCRGALRTGSFGPGDQRIATSPPCGLHCGAAGRSAL